jgi:hypothetical protein
MDSAYGGSTYDLKRLASIFNTPNNPRGGTITGRSITAQPNIRASYSGEDLARCRSALRPVGGKDGGLHKLALADGTRPCVSVGESGVP